MIPARLETGRLLIRPFQAEDLEEAHRILNEAFGPSPMNLEERRRWLEWSILSQEWHARMHQPPYGDLAVTLKSSGVLVGMVGYVPLLDAFEQLPSLAAGLGTPQAEAKEVGVYTPEVGLFWAIDPAHQRLGYATEAAARLITAAFEHLRLKRILATTEYTNLASQAVMRRLGMRLERNLYPTPPWLQVVGILDAPDGGVGGMENG